MDDRTLTRLRTQLAIAPRSGPGRGTPRTIRHQAAASAARHTAQCAPLTQIAEALGVSLQYLRR